MIVFKGLRLGLALAGAAFRSFFKIGSLAFIGIAWTLYENWERVRSFFATIWNAAEPHWMKFKSILNKYGVTDKILVAWNSVKNLFENIWSVAEPHWLKFKTIVDEYVVVDKITSAWTSVKNFFANIWNDTIPSWDAFTAPLSKIWDGAKSSISSVGNLFRFDDQKSSLSSKLPPMKNEQAAITKNQNNNFTINVNASKTSDPREVAKQVSKEMTKLSLEAKIRSARIFIERKQA